MPRCKDGDLALVIHDERACQINIGRVVTVSGPVRIDDQLGPTWLIQPVHRSAWAVTDGVRVILEMPPLRMVEHPDKWLLPLCPRQPEKSVARMRERREPEDLVGRMHMDARVQRCSGGANWIVRDVIAHAMRTPWPPASTWGWESAMAWPVTLGLSAQNRA